ncbi:MAG: phosphodiester glycosidase family protein [Casimicrobium sp.]
MLIRKFKLHFGLVAFALCVALATNHSLAESAPSVTAPQATVSLPPVTWTPLFEGVSHAIVTVNSPRPMVMQVLQIETQTRGLRFFATPGLPSPRKPNEETAGVRTSTFLETHALQAAINAAPYGPQRSEEGLAQDVAGLQVSNGDVISKQVKHYPAIVISKKNRARIVAPPFAMDNVHNAVGGFNIVLRDGEIIGNPAAGIHPRTAIGIDRSSDRMWWLVIDGRQSGRSEGASLADVAQVLKQLGADDAINLDGGGTTTMVVADDLGKARLLNRPIHSGIPGNERIAASHLGIFAPSLQSSRNHESKRARETPTQPLNEKN